jgi:CBS domain-containing protein
MALGQERLQSSIYLETTVNEQLGLLPGEARAVKHAMTSAVTVASPQTSVKDATTMMKELDVPVIVVYDGDRLVGVLSDRDVALNTPIPGTAEHMPIGSVMRTDVSTCREDDRLADASSLIRASNLEWLPVLDRGDHLVGVLSRYAVP